MNKKHIASACVALVGLSAFAVAQAQTNVTLYGLVDYGYTYRWDAKSLGTNTPGSQSQLNGGQSAENRLGFKGTEDLGNGLKAVFLLEQGFIHRLASVNAFVSCHHPQVRHSVPFLICDNCQNAIELEDERISDLLDQQAKALGFTPRAQTLEVHGLCANCQAVQAG